MSTTSGSRFSADDAGSGPVLWNFSTRLEYVIDHVFLPFPPVAEVSTAEDDRSLVRAVCAVAHGHSESIDDTLKQRWCGIAKMLDNLKTYTQSEWQEMEGHMISQLREMETGGTFFILHTSCTEGP